MKNLLLPALLALIPLTACAQTAPSATVPKTAAPAVTAPSSPNLNLAPGSDAARAAAALKTLDPNIPLQQIGAAPLPGFQEAVVGGQVVYVSNDGKYLLQGVLFDIAAKKNLGEATMASIRRKALAEAPKSDRIIFSPPNPVHTVTVFTDVECGFCRRMHQEMGELNRLGIAVEYLAFPRMGPASEDFRKMEAIWCSADRKKALTDAKNDKPVAAARCTNPVAAQYALGQRLGLTGTPMVLAADGSQLGGYLPPAQLKARLDALKPAK